MNRLHDELEYDADKGLFTDKVTFRPEMMYSGNVPWYRHPVIVYSGEYKGRTGTVEDVIKDDKTISGLKILVRFDMLRAQEGVLEKWYCYSQVIDPEYDLLSNRQAT